MRSNTVIRVALTGMLAVAPLVAGGCSSATKRHYLHHLSVTIKPAEPDSDLVALFDAERGGAASSTAIAAVETDR